MTNRNKLSIGYTLQTILGLVLIVSLIVFLKDPIQLGDVFHTTVNGIELVLRPIPYIITIVIAIVVSIYNYKYFKIKPYEMAAQKQLAIEDEMEYLGRLKVETTYSEWLDSIFIAFAIANLMLTNIVMIPNNIVAIFLVSLFTLKCIAHLVILRFKI
jgi:hypothetical protein